MQKMPLPQPERIKKRRSFKKATHNGKKFVMPTLVLQTVAQTEVLGKRVGFTTTKKLGKAVVRNRIRRRLKEATRYILPLRGKDGYDYVVVGRKRAYFADFQEIVNDLTQALKSFEETILSD